ncbi:phage NrS-1 polymerase family protein [Haloferax marisrubri]|uniref:NrS-1 polymerase-like HBD domain-containing protein n=1 Tax=Haloferax marisrubri TaxID=1544719 RepID=A0A2P4NL50_9EURY|nr:hypothetical protein [Haloferax marisrubri]POG53864.1 hypothetical protein AUR65_019040 [Haloferax marisrubri]
MTPPLPTREQLPDDLLERANWVGWRTQTCDGGETVVPRDAAHGGPASATDASTWATFDEALASARDGRADGVGFVFTDDDPFVGIKLDKCRDGETGAADGWARAVVDRLDSYTELNSSGTGYRVIVRGTLPSGSARAESLELSDDARFCPVTGDRVDGTPAAVAERGDALAAIHGAYFEADPEPSPTPPVEPATAIDSANPVAPSSDRTPADARLDEMSGPGNDLADDEVVRRASNAVNAVKFTHLWRGDAGGYDDHDEADAALCSILAFWTAGDARQMCRLFRDSGLFRPKWDEVAHADGSTYGAKTVQRAIRETSEYYDPSGRSSAVRRSPTPSDDDRKRDERADDAASEPQESNEPQGPHGPPPTAASPVGERGAFDRFNELRARLDDVVGENERLRDELEAERERRRDLEASVGDGGEEAGGGETDERSGRGWSLFGWLRS